MNLAGAIFFVLLNVKSKLASKALRKYLELFLQTVLYLKFKKEIMIYHICNRKYIRFKRDKQDNIQQSL